MFTTLFNSVPLPAVFLRITDQAAVVEQVNETFVDRFGYEAEDLTDDHFERQLLPPGEEPKPIGEKRVSETLQGGSFGTSSAAEVTLETTEGYRTFVRVSTPEDCPDSTNRAFTYYIDITEQKQREQRLQVLSRVLRHDIRNKVNVIQSSATTMFDAVDSPTAKRSLGRIERSAEKLLSMSRDIRLVEYLVANETDCEPIEVTDLVQSIFTDLRQQYPNCDFSVANGEAAEVAATRALEIALREVIENGVEHNDSAHPRVHVGIVRNTGRQYVTIRVVDNGTGISPSEYEVSVPHKARKLKESAC
jgi:PAS domain S-box-containing protein